MLFYKCIYLQKCNYRTKYYTTILLQDNKENVEKICDTNQNKIELAMSGTTKWYQFWLDVIGLCDMYVNAES